MKKTKNIVKHVEFATSAVEWGERPSMQDVTLWNQLDTEKWLMSVTSNRRS